MAVSATWAPAQEPGADKIPLGAKAQRPQWIWGTAVAGGEQVCRLRRVIELGEPVRKAELRMTCDNVFTAWLQGERILRGDEWERSHFADVTQRLRPGRNVLAVEAKNAGGKAGLIGVLTIELASGERRTIVTDAQWQVCGASDGRWRQDVDTGPTTPAHAIGPLGMEPWGDPFAPRFATPAAKLRTKAGYAVTLARSATDRQGSWVSMTFDARGRLYVGVERGGILRLSDPAGDGELEALALPPAVRNPQGMAWVGDTLWVNVNLKEDGGGLFRLRDADDDGAFEDVQRVFAWKGDGEHGAHAIVPGPDGWLWVINGNMTDLPEELAPTSPHRLYAEDVLLPPIEDPNGHAVGVKAPGSHVLRIAPDGSSVELFGAGMRNAYDFAFDVHGEIYTFDSDMEWDIGLPWYRPVRVCRMVSGAEFGWRSGTGCWPVHFFDSLPPVVDVGRGSPTGVTFWYGQAAGPAHGAFVAADWSLGRILLVRVGATPVTFDTLVSGKPMNVSDVAVGPDGALWFVTGGRGTQSGLYRIAWSQPAIEVMPPPEPATQTVRRRALEALHAAPSPDALDQAWPGLGDADREIRHAARVAVERQPVATWRARALGEEQPAAACAALLALARAGDESDLGALVDRWLALDIPSVASRAQSERGRQLEALRVLAVAFARRGAPDERRRAAVVQALQGPLPSDTLLARERAAILVFLGAPGMVPSLLAALQASVTQAEQIAFAFLLSHVGAGWDAETLARFGQWLCGAREHLGGGVSFGGYLDAIADTLGERLRDEALRAQVRAWPKPAARRADETVVAPGPFVRAWTLAELAPHLDAVGEGRSFAAGERAARSAQCIACHTFAGKGGNIGPDLTNVASRFGRRDLLEAIVEPSKVISEQYQLVALALRDGSTQTGRIVRESADEIVLSIDPIAGTKASVRAGDVVTRTPSPVSSMPPGLVNTLTLEQILDLLAYLENEGNKDAEAFK